MAGIEGDRALLDSRSGDGAVRSHYIEIKVSIELDLRGKHVLVIGTKRSGLAAIRLLLQHGAYVRAMDMDPHPLEGLEIEVVPQQSEFLKSPDLIVLSPAVPFDAPLVVEAHN